MKFREICVIALIMAMHQGAMAMHDAFKREPLIKTSTIESWFQETGKAPKNVEEFLSRLPQVYRGHFTLMYESQSMHRATPEAPRIIFYGPDSRLLTAVSTDPTDPRRNTVELIEYEPVPAKFSFYEVTFDGKSPKFVRNPTSCQNCHGSDGRPNWEPYDAWPGAYGSVHDTMKNRTHENALFSDFLKTYLREPRFLSLPKSFVLTQETFVGEPTYYTTSRGVGLNSTLSLLVNFANRERLTRIMVNSQNHARYKNAITAVLLGCPNPITDFIPKDLKPNHPRDFDTILTETRTMMDKDQERRVARTAKLQQITDLEQLANDIDHYGLRDREVTRIAGLRYLFENRVRGPISMDRWGLSLYRDSYNFDDGASGLENLIGHYIPAAFADSDPMKAKIRYKTTLFDGTSYSSIPQVSGKPDTFKLEVFEAEEPPQGLCADLAAAGQKS